MLSCELFHRKSIVNMIIILITSIVQNRLKWIVNFSIKFSNAIYDSTGQRPNVSLSTRLNVYCSCLTLSFLYSESCVRQCPLMLHPFPAVSVILNLPTIPLFDWFYCPMHAVTVTMRRNDLLASHVTLTQRHTIPPYPLASLTTNQCN